MPTPQVASCAFSDEHNHQRCIRTALATAERLCADRRCRLTPVRKRVLELVWQSHTPLGAYQILAQLGDEGFNSAPPTVYRALEFLQEQGLVHRIASLNAFTGCCAPDRQHHGYFLICRQCGRAHELEGQPLSQALREQAARQGFMVEAETVELTGLCPHCREPLA
ncbi:Fur family transcriptional regulator [Motiliproteus sediminis]|uniref:Fur family transcriptional regulator n=1 Tax=Motiliproteus sediminis TaxID=1468178 RepID=UPI001AEFD77D|nr:Fur family transcriptional regulator [Motiliproteus sediminis]